MSGERRTLIAAVWAGVDVLGFLVLFVFGSKLWSPVFLVFVAVGLVAFLRVTHPRGRAKPSVEIFFEPKPSARLEPIPLDVPPVPDDVAGDVVILPPPPPIEALPPPPVVAEPVIEEPVIEEPVIEEPEPEPVVDVVVEVEPEPDVEEAAVEDDEDEGDEDEGDEDEDDEDEDDEDEDDDDTEVVTEVGLIAGVVVDERRSPDEVLEAIIPVDLLIEPSTIEPATEVIDGIEIVVAPEREPGVEPVGAVVRTLEDIEAERTVVADEPPLAIDDEAVSDDADILRASEVATLEVEDAQAEDARRRQIYLLNKIRLELDEYE